MMASRGRKRKLQSKNDSPSFLKFFKTSETESLIVAQSIVKSLVDSADEPESLSVAQTIAKSLVDSAYDEVESSSKKKHHVIVSVKTPDS